MVEATVAKRSPMQQGRAAWRKARGFGQGSGTEIKTAAELAQDPKVKELAAKKFEEIRAARKKVITKVDNAEAASAGEEGAPGSNGKDKATKATNSESIELIDFR